MTRICGRGHPMKLVNLTQGEGTSEIDLGWLWWCTNDDNSKPDYCDECEDATEQQLELFEEQL